MIWHGGVEDLDIDVHLCISLVDSESSCPGNVVRHKSFQSSGRPAFGAGCGQAVVGILVAVKGCFICTIAVAFLLEGRGLPAFLPFMT